MYSFLQVLDMEDDVAQLSFMTTKNGRTYLWPFLSIFDLVNENIHIDLLQKHIILLTSQNLFDL